jgi:hypothetical protein
MLVAVKVNTPRTTGTAAAADFNMINKILFRHAASDGATVNLPA